MTTPELMALFEPVAAREGARICAVRIGGSPRNPLIQVFADLERGYISIAACAALCRDFRDLLDMTYGDLPDYRLIVSSPGLDFELSELWQFRKNVDKWLRRTDAQGTVEGRIAAVTDDGEIIISNAAGESRHTLSALAGAKIILEPRPERKTGRKRHDKTRNR